jgi:predicted DNA-binding protein
MAESTAEGRSRVTVGCKVSPDKRQRLRVIAAKQDKTMSELLRERIGSILDEHDE